jgi:methyltransferase (TIGR00027 family)
LWETIIVVDSVDASCIALCFHIEVRFSEPMKPVGSTALWTAAVRAEEHRRADRLFADPFAERLAGEAGQIALDQSRRAGGNSEYVVIRTRFFDDALMNAVESGIRQVVIVAAGFDARAYRLTLPRATVVYEIDQRSILDHKRRVLAACGAPLSRSVSVPADLEQPFGNVLAEAGHSSEHPTVWLLEGLTYYLDAPSVDRLFRSIGVRSALGSKLLADFVGESLLQHPRMQPALEALAAMGAPWRYGCDSPAVLLASLGWTAQVYPVGTKETSFGRWRHPPLSPAMSYSFACANRGAPATSPLQLSLRR